MNEFIGSFLKSLLSFSFATLLITIQPATVLADNLSDDAIQAELGLEPAKLDRKELEAPKTAKVDEKREGKAPVMAAPLLVTPPSKKK